jgi:predicted TIM-barrel fold metal-dependent hydrolase
MHGHTSVEDRTSAARLASAAAEMGVRRVVLLGDVLAFGYHPTPEQIRIINDATIADVAAFPDLYVGLCYLSPEHDPDFLAAEAERCIRGHGLKGVKLEATVRARDARLDPILDIRPYPNVVVDTSGSQPMGEMIEYAVRTIGADRIVYGSDVPGRDFSAQLGRVWGARLGDADRHRILHRNAERLLGL